MSRASQWNQESSDVLLNMNMNSNPVEYEWKPPSGTQIFKSGQRMQADADNDATHGA